MQPGTFVVISRVDPAGAQWDEVLLGYRIDAVDWIVYTTTASGDGFAWSCVRLTVGNFRLVVGVNGARAAPAGLAGASSAGGEPATPGGVAPAATATAAGLSTSIGASSGEGGGVVSATSPPFLASTRATPAAML